MSPGELRQTVTVERFTETPDGAGGVSRSWAPLITIRANAVPRGGGERLIAGTLRSKQGWTVTIRRRGDMTITNKDRFRLGTEVLNIGSIEDAEGYGEWLVALCETGSAN